MKRLCGFALFFIAVGMIINCFTEGFLTFLIITGSLLLAYCLFCK